MAQKSKIEWTQKTWNPVTGCTKVSQGCKNCYAEVLAKRFWKGRKFTDVHSHDDRLAQPLKWRKAAKVFVNSMSDLFHENVPFEFIEKVWTVMVQSPLHTFQILTKRPEQAVKFFKVMQEKYPKNKGFESYYEYGLKNVWLGVSVEDQKTADERIPVLLQIPAAVRFLSCEPLLGEIDLSKWVTVNKVKPMQNWFYAKCNTCGYIGSSEHFEGGYPLADTGDYSDIECPKCNSLAIDDNVSDPLHWVICGGESGHGARPMHPAWARKLRDDCRAAGVPYFFKQWGEYRPYEETAQAPFYRDCNTNAEYDAHGMDFLNPFTGNPGKFKGFKWMDGMEAIDVCGAGFADCMFLKMGKKAAGRLLDGVEHNGMPK